MSKSKDTIKVETGKIDVDKAVLEVEQKMSTDKLLEKVETDKISDLQKQMFQNLMLQFGWAFAVVFAIWGTWIYNITGPLAVAVIVSCAVATFGISIWIQSAVAKTFLGKFEHRAKLKTLKKNYKITYIPQKILTTQIDGWYVSEVFCEKKYSSLPFLVIVHKKPWNECFNYERKFRFRFGVVCPILTTEETLIDLTTLPSEHSPSELEEKVPVPVCLLADCDGYNKDLLTALHVPVEGAITAGIKGLDTLESIRLKNLLAMREAELREIQTSQLDAAEAGARIALTYLGQKEIVGSLVKKGQSRWQRMSTKAKASIIAFAIIFSVAMLFVGLAIGGAI
jgi:hypothetical protein